ncbi:LuxR C-terminal-related transcriptional regulator [Symmachiella dynata]|uniref:Bacterial regulatory protein, luxR family n=1 Tax=Symmachiella dynata TaxID=2527995 RepID=A0A517ZU20_9PLAN|nr:LuxR C-terminal-related transcriptional regulator [Symmachiella dynata]QDT50243.1 Bacterial regulatory protein, luxR family [Symmachiella dynata]QDU45971.1 Bacterial regulatory protein, luxR family [Symmachiella dynata]|tara:strand:- start:674 stop:1057 length:384 start_codon:yes stop_codon:yes gene_type:complete
MAKKRKPKSPSPGEDSERLQRRAALWSKEDLLSPADPAEDLLTPEEWISIGIALDLSTRELCVAILIFEGQTRANIARQLHKKDGQPVSPGTIRVYIDRLFQKLRVNDRVGFVQRIMRVHLRLSAAS